jgi:hypothetical protein
MPETRSLQKYILFCLALLCLICVTCTSAENFYPAPEPSLYFSFDEGGGIYSIDGSGNGNTGTLHGVSRAENGVCGRSVLFDGSDSYIEIPFSSRNHPTGKITVSAWFYTNSFEPQVMISTDEDGGYRLGFDDGEDLWWTLNLKDTGEVSLPIQHEGISLNEWHHITGTYDGHTVKMYLDGVLRNQMNATGEIQYRYNNYVMLGADAGVYNQTDRNCPLYYRGLLDEVRIYAVALTYSQVMDDRFGCFQEPGLRSDNMVIQSGPLSSCADVSSGSVIIGPHEKISRVLSIRNQTEQGSWNVTLAPGSTLVVQARDFYPGSYPDAWYAEIADENGRITRSVAFPNRNNAPLKGVVPSGNATVFIRYFDGKGRFPAKVAVEFESVDSPTPPVPPQTILNYPIIVIYSVSWATLIAIILVMVWLHRRSKPENKKELKDK